ncbi:MAG TPA: thioredoxin domain-containing protein [Candidatus Nanoarchaeia archaeon]|nr:thioredoxin domain-containing protein [Candidatus Nanoarchaeia archaeon]
MEKESKKVRLEFEALTLWKSATVVLAVLLIISIVTGGFSLNENQPADVVPTPAGTEEPQGNGWSGSPKALLMFKTYASEIGLDKKKFDSCLDNRVFDQEIQDDTAACQAAGTSGTPTFYINGQQIVGAQPYAAFETAIEEALKNPSVGSNVISIEGDPIMGDVNAPVTMVSCEDYQCPFCQRAFLQTFPQIKQNYIDTGKVRYVFKDFPLPFHSEADEASLAAECAGEQGKYYEMHEKLFENQQ